MSKLLVAWCVFRVSPKGRVRELRNIHPSEHLARKYVAEHPIPAREGRLEVEDWLVGRVDAFEGIGRNPGATEAAIQEAEAESANPDPLEEETVIEDVRLADEPEEQGFVDASSRTARAVGEMLTEQFGVGEDDRTPADHAEFGELRSSGIRAMRDRRKAREP